LLADHIEHVVHFA